jgi:hypothetical protein
MRDNLIRSEARERSSRCADERTDAGDTPGAMPDALERTGPAERAAVR